MRIDVLKEIAVSVAGVHAVGVVYALFDKKNVNEFLVAKKLNFTINQTRNILYKLADQGLVSFIRKKDSKKGGWYIYFWTFNTGKALGLCKQRIQASLTQAQLELEQRKKQRFYFSPGAGIEYTEEQALEHGFVCPETGEVMQLKDSSANVIDIEKKTISFSEDLNNLDVELAQIHKKEEQTRMRKHKLGIKKRSVELKKRAAERRRLAGKPPIRVKDKKKGKKIKKKEKKKDKKKGFKVNKTKSHKVNKKKKRK